MRAWGITDIGLRRQENQDTFALDHVESAETVVAVVCDGMGGVNGGKLASSIAAETFMDGLRRQLRPDMDREESGRAQTLSVSQANRAVFERSVENPELSGMGTTLVSAVVTGNEAVICNVGDSRAYHISAEGIRRVTRDHSVVESLVESGDLTPEQARTHPNRNLITRALGPERFIESDLFAVRLAEGDSLLLCSDGLTIVLEDREILEVLRAGEDGQAALERLVALTMERGAPDNVTAVLIRAGKGGDGAWTA